MTDEVQVAGPVAEAKPEPAPAAAAKPKAKPEPLVVAAGIVAPSDLAPEAFDVSPQAASAARDHLEMRVSELAAYLKGEMQHFDGVDAVCQLVTDQLKATL